MSHAWKTFAVWVTCALVVAACGSKDDSDTAVTDTDGTTDVVECPLRWSCDSGEVETFFLVYCANCHDTPPMDFTNYADVLDHAETIRCGVAPGRESLPRCGSDPKPEDFPVGDGPLPSRNERQLIVDWIDAGAQQ